jgi:hypothetical protein
VRDATGTETEQIRKAGKRRTATRERSDGFMRWPYCRQTIGDPTNVSICDYRRTKHTTVTFDFGGWAERLGVVVGEFDCTAPGERG